MLQLLTLVVLVVLTLTNTSVAQDSAATQTTPPVRNSLKLEINYSPVMPSAFIDVRGVDQKPTWIWVTRFVRIPSWRLPVGELPIRAVRLEPLFNGETIEVRITVMRGVNSVAEQEQLVTKVHLEPGERRSIAQLSEFGIEPFYISVNNTPTALPPEPVFDLRVNAIEVAGVERQSFPLPSYKLKFRNLTDKPINALRVQVVNGPSVFYQGDDGKPLIEAGGTHEEILLVGRPVERDGKTVVGSANVNTIVISSAVFADGTHDGADGPACAFESMSIGRKLWLKTAIPLLDELLQASADAPTGAALLKAKLLALKFETIGVEQGRFSTNDPECARHAAIVEITEQSQRQTLVRELDQMIATRPAPPINFNVWVQTLRTRYAEWLGRLEQQGY